MRLLILVLSALVPLAAISCAGKNDDSQPVSRVSPRQAEALGADHSRFDSAEDPPFLAQTHFAAAQLAESQNSTARAIAQYREALKVDPAFRPALYHLALLQTKLRDFPAAIETWNLYVEKTDHHASAYANLALAHDLAGDVEAAERAYQRGLLRDERSQICRVNYGLMLARLNRVNEAIAQLQAVLPAGQVHYNLASVHEQLGRIPEAQSEYRKALAADPGLKDARSRLAAIE